VQVFTVENADKRKVLNSFVLWKDVERKRTFVLFCGKVEN